MAQSWFELTFTIAELVLDLFVWVKKSTFNKNTEKSKPVTDHSKNKRKFTKKLPNKKITSRRDPFSFQNFQTKAPGSLMLFGEHAVLHGGKALVLAVDKYIHVKLVPRNDETIVVKSELGSCELSIFEIMEDNSTPALKFVMAAIKVYGTKLNKGFTLFIHSDFSHTVGLGSSAAVVVAVLRVLSKYCQDPLDTMALFLAAKNVIISVQGMGSGADVAASVFGGVVLYCAEPLAIKSMKTLPPITVVYSGYKTPTPEVIRQVEARFKNTKELLKETINDINVVTMRAISALEQGDWQSLGQEMNLAQNYMRTLGVSDDILEQKIKDLRSDPNISGAKISGAGMGDCVIAIGNATKTLSERIAVQPSLQGICDTVEICDIAEELNV